MTIQEVKQMTIGVLENKTIALCRTTRGGKLVPVRPITGEECVAITTMFYAMFRSVHPEEKIMPLPFSENSALAITEIELNK